MMLSQVVKKYHGLNIDEYNSTITAQKNAELYSYELDCSAIQLLVVLCLLVGIFQIVMGNYHTLTILLYKLTRFLLHFYRYFSNGCNLNYSF